MTERLNGSAARLDHPPPSYNIYLYRELWHSSCHVTLVFMCSLHICHISAECGNVRSLMPIVFIMLTPEKKV